MPELKTLAEIEEMVRGWEYCRAGFVPVQQVLDDAVNPLLSMLRRSPRWVTLTDALRRLGGRSKTFLLGELSELDGLSRREYWEKQGLTYQNEDGIWLISEVALMTVTASEALDEAKSGDPEIAASRLLGDAE